MIACSDSNIVANVSIDSVVTLTNVNMPKSDASRSMKVHMPNFPKESCHDLSWCGENLLLWSRYGHFSVLNYETVNFYTK